MTLVRDELLRASGGVYHLRVYQDGDWLPVIILGQLDDCDGETVTNAIEDLAAFVDHLLGRSLAAEEYVLFEHWPATTGALAQPARFDRVTCRHNGERYWLPEWRHTRPEDVAVLAGEEPRVWPAGSYTTRTLADR